MSESTHTKRELKALEAIIDALAPLSREERERVVRYVAESFGDALKAANDGGEEP